jgi:hypothetical protein
MTDYDNNVFEGFEEEPPAPEQGSQNQGGGGGNNRSFLIAVGIIAGVTVLLAIGGVILYILTRSGGSGTRAEQAAQINAANTATSIAATTIAQAEALARTPSATPIPTATEAPSPTPVVVFPTNTPRPSETPAVSGTSMDLAAVDSSARTQTVAALLTQAASSGSSPTPNRTTTALPTTGFAEDVGLPGLLALSLALVVVIFLVRRLRVSQQ